ncbi:MAG: bacillithiol biosynthesis cysteine-adding enzyme BshC [Pyrinomonadaceae bacterium]
MSQKSARDIENKFSRQHKLSFEKIPHQSRLFLDFQKNSAAIGKFYPEKQTALADYAAEVLDNYRVDRAALCDILSETNESLGASRQTIENIERLRESDCTTIVTGQQAGLFSGAIYTIYKAVSAIKLAAELKKQNVKAVPVFWIAEEDHDFDEVKKTFVLDSEGKLAAIENTPQNYAENFPVGAIRLDETVNKTIENLLEILPRTEFSGAIKNFLSETYQSGETYSAAFAKFLTKIFADYGLIILSPLDERLKKLCSPIFAKAVENSDRIVSALLERNRELKAENYAAQVLVAEDSFPFFYQNENGERQALRKNTENSKLEVQNSKREFEQSELIEIARNSPRNLSPNALLRPVVQDYLLPTLLYFGGAAEVAYFAQNSVIYEILNRPVTPIRHRASYTIIEPKHARTLRKYQINFTDLFGGKEKILTEIVEKYINTETARVFAETEEIINAQLNRLEGNLSNNEPTLAENSANRRKKILWHIAALRKKYHRAEILKNETIHRRIENLFNALLPNDALQERALNVATFINLYGANFIEWIYDATDSDEKEHQILYL